MDNAIALLKVAIYWVILGLVIHLVIRAIWVGLVGLSYSFPGGIDHERLKYSDRFREKLKQIPDYESIIISLEKLASSVFSISFLLFMCILGTYFYILVLLILPLVFLPLLTGMEFDGIYTDIYTIAILIVGFIGLLDFLSLGYVLKRIPRIAAVYWPIYRVVSIFTLARLYRSIYYSFVSNFARWKIVAFLCVFVICSFFWFANILNRTYPGDSISRIKLWNNRSGYSVFNGYYDDQNEEKYSIRAQIQSDIITGNTVRLFVAANVEREKDIREYSGMDSLLQKNPGFDPDSLALEAFGSFYHIHLGDSLLTDLTWKFHYKAHTRQKGYLSYIDIKDLPAGLYELKVSSPRGIGYANILFYREE